MSISKEQLQSLVNATPPVTIEDVHRRVAKRARRRRVSAQLVAFGFAAMVAAAAALYQLSVSHHHPVSLRTSSPLNSSPSGFPRSVDTFPSKVVASGPLQVRLHFPSSHVAAGQTLNGLLVVSNHGKAVTVGHVCPDTPVVYALLCTLQARHHHEGRYSAEGNDLCAIWCM
jgi:hypothetical protein